MKILVTVKRIPDPDESLKFAGNAIDTSSSKWVANAFDEYAVETALRMAEHIGNKDRLAEVIVCSVCPKDKRQHVTQFLAMGADRGVIVDADETAMDSQTVAKLVAEVFRREGCDLLVSGKLSQDSEGNEVAQRAAGLLDLPQASFAATLRWDRGANALTVGREVDDGVETKTIPLPAVVSVDLRIVLPHSVKNGATADDHKYSDGARLASLRGITMAKRKKVDVHTPAALGVTPSSHVAVAGVTAPEKRAAGQIVDSAQTLVNKLITEAKVL
ncbi:electron transfer flavoprotein subunit beta/FixA family protein [Paraliomyxa miuraensis]|uniref:electron transfer flavoprotein subunit beta/FixA family protein n=1 Tax=Paraliomyxa miuraensis TaxID=376150 RepID=UPI0022522A68|nr:electron transfer flavoprotein subunit beta/FixA family protein [Paraliomyxa miuraensis]MCX4243263.1 electron transfer flavoprotein subunit beta/FixA family protein [Paraliomyxa miuraensis]